MEKFDRVLNEINSKIDRDNSITTFLVKALPLY